MYWQGNGEKDKARIYPSFTSDPKHKHEPGKQRRKLRNKKNEMFHKSDMSEKSEDNI